MQSYRVFFGEYDKLGRSKPNVEEIKEYLDSAYCPINNFVGNTNAIEKLKTILFTAFMHPYHLCREIAFSIFGPASSGKTTLVKLFAKTIHLPMIEFSPQVKCVEDIFKEICSVLQKEGIPLIEAEPKHYELPPCVIFFDEVHALKDKVVQALLKATEYNDGILVTENGKTINCHNVCWMIATTDEGMLFDAFRTRFSPLNLVSLTCKEIAQIVKLANKDFPIEVCEAIAFYNKRVPRKALEFARFVKMKIDQNSKTTGEINPLDIVCEVAMNEGIDAQGVSKIHRTVLDALHEGAVSKGRMPIIVGKKKEEVERYIMPWLMTETSDCKAWVTVSNKGYILTEAGREAYNEYVNWFSNESFERNRTMHKKSKTDFYKEAFKEQYNCMRVDEGKKLSVVS